MNGKKVPAGARLVAMMVSAGLDEPPQMEEQRRKAALMSLRQQAHEQGLALVGELAVRVQLTRWEPSGQLGPDGQPLMMDWPCDDEPDTADARAMFYETYAVPDALVEETNRARTEIMGALMAWQAPDGATVGRYAAGVQLMVERGQLSGDHHREAPSADDVHGGAPWKMI